MRFTNSTRTNIIEKIDDILVDVINVNVGIAHHKLDELYELISKIEVTPIDSKIKEDVQAKVFRIIAEKLGVYENKVELKSNLINDLGADSIDGVELVMALEDEFDIPITDEEAYKIFTVQDAIDLVEGKL